MNSSAICSVAIMMLCLIHSPSLASAARSLGEQKQSLIAEICNEIREEDRKNCVEILKVVDPKIEEVKNFNELADAIANIGSKIGTEAQEFIKGLEKINNSPGMVKCENEYGYVARSFEWIPGAIKSNRASVDYDVAVLIDGPSECERGLANEHNNNPAITAFKNQTTYENFRYRADGQINAFNRGCLNNFLEVFCTKVKPSRNYFRAFVREEVPPRPLAPIIVREREPNDLAGDRRPKVEADLDIGEDLLKISHRRNIEVLDEDIQSRGSNGPPHNTSEPDSILSADHRAPTIRSDARHSSWERSGNWEIAQEVLGNSNVTETRNYVTSKEMRQ